MVELIRGKLKSAEMKKAIQELWLISMVLRELMNSFG